ncbi:MAG: rhodanese-like domain-containing protein, partial [Coriobacteriia bacterium]|nr:rhodanese-like domain-containing protein [Coriobacteriia bacterium]
DSTDSERSAEGGVTTVDEQELAALASEGVLVVDVRSPGEFAQGHVPGAVNVPYTEIPAVAARWDLAEPIAVYCLSGDRSGTAVDTLVRMGFREIYHFDAGLQAWNGQLDQGSSAPIPETGSEAAITGPVMYEFYSDG